MAFWRVLVPLLVLSVLQISSAEVPVYIWGDLERTSIKHSALSSVPYTEFRKILKEELIEDPFTVVFIEETLSVEDFSRKIEGETYFPYLEDNIGNAVYLPSVENPLKVLNKIVDPEEVNHVKLTDNGLSADMGSQDGRYFFINLKDAREGESREELLRRHNDFMEDMVNKLKERYPKVVAIYTAHYPSWTVVEHSRVRRQAETAPSAATPTVTSLEFKGLKIYFQAVLINNGTGNDTALSGGIGDAGSFVNETIMNSTLIFSNNTRLTLNFESHPAGYWFLIDANLVTPTVEKTLYAEEGLYGYTGFSYRCATDIKLASKSSQNSTEQPWTITFQNSRMQPFFIDNSTLEFGDTLNCVGFFTAPIWAGLFVVAIMLAITFYGIMMMMDIRTMDRFDDPKGKTITINASE